MFASPALRSCARSLRYHAWLAVQLAVRDIQTRYRSTRLGWLWAFVAPLLMLVVYTLTFKYIFRVRWVGAGDDPLAFALHLLAGLLVFQAVAECWARAPRLILEQPHLVKKVVFPLSLLPWASVVNVLFHALMSMALLVLVAGFSGVPLRWQWGLLPLLLLPLAVLLWSSSLLLASLGVFIRDLPQVVTLVVGLLQFLSPVFYPVSSLPADVQGLASWNPLTVYMEQIRAWVFAETQPTWGQWSHSLLITGVLLVSGYALFRRLKKGFADVI
jgi:lipopolysaccharide transport system permease protein